MTFRVLNMKISFHPGWEFQVLIFRNFFNDRVKRGKIGSGGQIPSIFFLEKKFLVCSILFCLREYLIRQIWRKCLVPSFALSTRSFMLAAYYMACVCSQYNACADWLYFKGEIVT